MIKTLKGALDIACAHEKLQLLPQRAIYWPRKATLFITDPHFGKDASFRRAGIGLPQGGTESDLQILAEVLTQSGAARLIILGDFFHTKSSRSANVLDALAAWRGRCQTLAITLVRGNHDHHAGKPPDVLNIDCVGEALQLSPFICYHAPLDEEARRQDDPSLYGLCGHLHPVFALRDRDGTSLRLPAFHFAKHQAILPAFGRFTGGYEVHKHRDQRVFLVGEQRIFEV